MRHHNARRISPHHDDDAAADAAADGAAPAGAPRPNAPAPWMPGHLTLDQLLGPPPVTWGEDPEAFAQVHGRLLDLLKPFNGIEQGLVRDLVFWSAQGDRYDRWGVELRPHLRMRGLRATLTDVVDDAGGAALAAGCLKGDPATLEAAERALARRGLTLDQVTAAAAATTPEYAQLTRAAGECERQMDVLWRRVERSRDARDRAHRIVNQRLRRQRAEDAKIRQADIDGLRNSLLKGRAVHPAALRPWPAPLPLKAEGAEVAPHDDGVFHRIPEAPFERPEWVAGYTHLMDLLPLAGGRDDDYLYHLYLFSTYPDDILEERFVRSAVQARREQNQLQRDLIALFGASLSTTLLQALRELAPDADHGPLMAGYQSDPDARRQVEDILASSGLTMLQIEARGVLRDIKMISTLQGRLIEAQGRSISVEKALEERRAAASLRRPPWVERLRDGG